MERIDYADKIKTLSTSIVDHDSRLRVITPRFHQIVLARITGMSLPKTLREFNSQGDFLFDEPLREVARCHYRNARMVPSIKISEKDDEQKQMVEMLVQAFLHNNRDSDKFKFLTVKYGRDEIKVKSIFNRMAENFDTFMEKEESYFISELILPCLISIQNVLELRQNI